MKQDAKEVAKYDKEVSEGKGYRRDNKKSRKYSDRRAPKSGNDYAYWNNYPELLSDAIKFPWYYIPGLTITGQSGKAISPTTLLHIRYVGTPGRCSKGTDPLNLQIRNTWLAMHRKFRGLGTYQCSDLAIAILAMVDVYEMVAELEFIYGMFHAYPINNRQFPRLILEKLGYDPTFLTDVEFHLADFRYSINRLIIKAHRLYLPKGLSALYYRIGMAGFIYSDSKSPRCSVFKFTPQLHFMWDGTSVSTGSALMPKLGLPEASVIYPSATGICQYVEKFIDVLISDDDITRMTSDLLACYGEAGVDALIPLVEDYAIAPQYSEVMLNKLHNLETSDQYATAAGSLRPVSFGSAFTNSTVASDCDAAYSSGTDTATLDNQALRLFVTQDNNNVVFLPFGAYFGLTSPTRTLLSSTTGFYYTVDGAVPTTITSADTVASGHLCDSWEEAPSDETRCDANLFKTNRRYITVVGTSPTYSSNIYDLESFGPELILKMNVMELSGTYNDRVPTFNANSQFTHRVFQMLDKVDWHPLVQWPGLIHDEVAGDMDNVTRVDNIITSKIHDAALLSAFKFALPKGSGDDTLNK